MASPVKSPVMTRQANWRRVDQRSPISYAPRHAAAAFSSGFVWSIFDGSPGGPPGIALNAKTNPRSALESTTLRKNEPKTNPNEPKPSADFVLQVLCNQRLVLGYGKRNLKRIQNEPKRSSDLRPWLQTT
jgi:hypothetical protein